MEKSQVSMYTQWKSVWLQYLKYKVGGQEEVGVYQTITGNI